MGAAAVIPGVSGGTVAFVTGIFETLVSSLKSFDAGAMGHLMKFRAQEFWAHINGKFLLPLGLGIAMSMVSLARLLGYLFDNHPILIWALFFGLILASVHHVGKTVGRWGTGPIVGLLAGLGMAVTIALLKPASVNTGLLYLVLCGVAGVCSMIIPGLSGSFVLILMGNYRLILDAFSDLVSAGASFDLSAMAAPLKIFAPVIVGVVVGLVAFSHVISWLFRRFRNLAVALLTGFVTGSLMTIWPWKHPVYEPTADGAPAIDPGGAKMVQGYDWYLPTMNDSTTWLAMGLMIIGAMAMIFMESSAQQGAGDGEG